MKGPEFQAVTALSEDVDEPSRKYLKTFKDWKLYRKDIETRGNSQPEPGNVTWLGCFTYTRDQQLAILNRCIGRNTSESAGQTLSEGTWETTEGQGQHGSEPELSNTRSHDARETLAAEETMTSSTPSLTSSAPLSRVFSVVALVSLTLF
jgi:hypothetical protein